MLHLAKGGSASRLPPPGQHFSMDPPGTAPLTRETQVPLDDDDMFPEGWDDDQAETGAPASSEVAEFDWGTPV